MEAWKDVKWVNIRVDRRETQAGLIWDGIMLNVTHSKQAEAEIRRSRAQLSALAAHVESVKEQERLNLAREVHDDLGGNLTAVKIGLSWLKRHLPPGEADLIKRTAYLDNVVDQTIEATHRIASSLRPPVLDFGIVSAIDWQLKRFGQNTDIACELSAPDTTIPLGAEADITVFRIVQEALTNVAKHARAKRVRVTLALQQGELCVSVTDNGQGIQPEHSPNNGHGFGLLGMRERAAALGGELSVQPAKRRGTQVSLRIPLPPPTPGAVK
jgi:signal transduction histidine kinase